MEERKIDMFLATKAKYFPADKIPYLREELLYADDSKYVILLSSDLKDPVILLVVSIFLGYLGIDRFLLGDISMGILKLLTGGCCGVLTIIDWITIMGKTKEKNFEDLMYSLHYY